MNNVLRFKDDSDQDPDHHQQMEVEYSPQSNHHNDSNLDVTMVSLNTESFEELMEEVYSKNSEGTEENKQKSKRRCVKSKEPEEIHGEMSLENGQKKDRKSQKSTNLKIKFNLISKREKRKREAFMKDIGNKFHNQIPCTLMWNHSTLQNFIVKPAFLHLQI